MPELTSCVVCGKALDDGRRRRRDATTCSSSCRTALWRSRRRIRKEGGEPYINVTGDGRATLARYDPPASPVTSPADARFAAQLRQLEESARPLTDEDRRVRRLQRANRGVLLAPLHARLIGKALEARAAEEEAIRANVPIAVQDTIHNPDSTVIARRGMVARQANRHLTADPNSYVDKPVPGPSGPQRYPGTAPEAEMIDAPWRRGR